MTLHCKNCASSLFTLLMKRLRILPDPLRRASGCNVWLMEGIGAIHSSARPEVGVRVTIRIGAAWAPGVGGENSRQKTIIRFLGAPYIEVLRSKKDLTGALTRSPRRSSA
jgi:hypothetical protein